MIIFHCSCWVKIFGSYIVDNYVLGCNFRFGDSTVGGGNRAYNLLLDLFSHPKTKSAFPVEEQPSKNLEKLSLSSSWKYLIGYDDYYPGLTLDISLAIRDHDKLPVLIPYYEYCQMPFDSQIELSAKEAFLILSNCLVNTRASAFESIILRRGKLSFAQKNLKNHFVNLDEVTKKYPPTGYFDNLKKLDNYTFNYLEYLKEQLEMEELIPYEILRLNGPRVLSLLVQVEPVKIVHESIMEKTLEPEALTRNEKIMYLAFLDYTQYTLLQKMKKYYQKYGGVLNPIEREITKKFDWF